MGPEHKGNFVIFPVFLIDDNEKIKSQKAVSE